MNKFFFLLIFLIPGISIANPVTVKQAMSVGKNFYFERSSSQKIIDYNELNLVYVMSDKNEDPSYYIFNINNDGYIIVSADDAVIPILGYGIEGNFATSNISPELTYVLNNYSKQIIYTKKNKIAASEKIKKQWTDYTEKPSLEKAKSIQTVGPLLLSLWDQSFPFNSQCPVDAAGSGGHAIVGCVAISLSQVMKYYNYPLHGTGTKTHYSNYGTHTVNFANQTYNWNAMQHTLLPSSDYSEMSKLLYHAGVAVEMDWGPDASGAMQYNMVTAYVDYFKYDPSCEIITRDQGFTDETWKSALMQQIDMNRPMCYVGYGDAGGHAWNCDGYQGEPGNELFHMNWGWGGSSNGYFSLSDVSASPSMSFNDWQQVIINIFPAANYPEQCSTLKTFTTNEANFDDGSGNQDYLNNSNCQYLIQLACGNNIHLKFDRFDIAADDAVYIFDGTSTSDNLIAVIYGGNIPTEYYSAGTNMLIRFETNNTGTKPGWEVSYNIEYCKYNGTIFSQATGTFDDGSGSCNYRNLSNCKWVIDIPNASSISLNFNSFDLAADGDFLSVYKNDISTSNLVQKYTYLNVPTGSLLVNASKLIFRFFANNSSNAPGWSLTYNAFLTDIQTQEISVTDVYIYPNPTAQDANIEFDLTQNSFINFSITNILGQVLYSYNKNEIAGHFQFNLHSLLPQITTGVYFVNLKTDKNLITKKLILE